MRYAYDTEFLEDGSTIELISIGIVAEDGREYYAVNADFRWDRIAKRRWYPPRRWDVREPWLLENVVSHLPKYHGDARLHLGRPGPFGIVNWRDRQFKRRDVIAEQVCDFFLAGDGDPELWADYCAYDHVVLCQLWGRMIDLPRGMPFWTHDLRQAIEAQPDAQLPPEPKDAHNALADARHVLACLRALDVT